MRHFLRRFAVIRYCILEYHKRERSKRADILWQYRSSVMQTLGQIVITWAGIEMMIDHLIAWYHPLAGRTDIQEEQPVNFERKMDYLNKMARDPNFDEVAQRGLRELRTEGKRLNKARKLMIHGVTSHQNGFSSIWHVSIREFFGAESVLKTYPVKDADIREILRQMGVFASDISPWISDLTGLTKNAVANRMSANSE